MEKGLFELEFQNRNFASLIKKSQNNHQRAKNDC